MCGLTAGDVALSQNNAICYRLIRDAGIRSEFLLRALEEQNINTPQESLVLKTSEDDSAAGSSATFLASKLRHTRDANGQEMFVATLNDGEEVGVM